MKKEKRLRKHLKIRKHIYGTKERPRLSVFRSNQHIMAQLIDDTKSQTIVWANDMTLKENSKKAKAYEVGKKLAEKALKLKIKKVVFDRGGFLYTGRVAELARGAKEGGLEF